jgi:hypothetical protein
MSKPNKILAGMRQAVAYAKGDTSVAVRKTVIIVKKTETSK